MKQPIHLSYTPSVFADAYTAADRRSAFRIGSWLDRHEWAVEWGARLLALLLLLGGAWIVWEVVMP